jgi:uncharacterized protein YjbI with pentapeptide repeats
VATPNRDGLVPVVVSPKRRAKRPYQTGQRTVAGVTGITTGLSQATNTANVADASSIVPRLRARRPFRSGQRSITTVVQRWPLVSSQATNTPSISDLPLALIPKLRARRPFKSGQRQIAKVTRSSPLRTSITSVSSIGATLKQAEALSASIASVSVIGANLAVKDALFAAIASVSTLGTTLKQSEALRAAITSVSTLGATLKQTEALKASITSVSTVGATLKEAQTLAANLASVSTVGATLKDAEALKAAIASVSTLVAALTPPPPAAHLRSISSLAADLSGVANRNVPQVIVGRTAFPHTFPKPIAVAGQLATVSAIAAALSIERAPDPEPELGELVVVAKLAAPPKAHPVPVTVQAPDFWEVNRDILLAEIDEDLLMLKR